MTDELVEVSVVVPTIGRIDLLGDCIASLVACRPRAAEVLVVDQSGDPAVCDTVRRFEDRSVRRLPCDGKGTSRAMNRGLLGASHEPVLVTHDDCRVDRSWVGLGARLLAGDDDLLVTGRVLPEGPPAAVPSTKDDPRPHDFTGELHCGALYPNNMGFRRSSVLRFGGFDERIRYAEDNDLSYRWLRSGRRLRYHPELVVWHRDWRSPEALEQLYVNYWHSQGVFYAKHLRGGDPHVMRFLANDAVAALRLAVSRLVHGRKPWPDPRAGIIRGLPRGVRDGLRQRWDGEGNRIGRDPEYARGA